MPAPEKRSSAPGHAPGPDRAALGPVPTASSKALPGFAGGLMEATPMPLLTPGASGARSERGRRRVPAPGLDPVPPSPAPASAPGEEDLLHGRPEPREGVFGQG